VSGRDKRSIKWCAVTEVTGKCDECMWDKLEYFKSVSLDKQLNDSLEGASSM